MDDLLIFSYLSFFYSRYSSGMGLKSGLYTPESAGSTHCWVHTGSRHFWSMPAAGSLGSFSELAWDYIQLSVLSASGKYIRLSQTPSPSLVAFYLQTIILTSISTNSFIEKAPFLLGSVRTVICLLCLLLYSQPSEQSRAQSRHSRLFVERMTC